MELVSYNRAVDVTANIIVGNVNVRALEKSNSFVQMGVLIDGAPGTLENIACIPAGQNATVILPFEVGKIHRIKFGTINKLNTTSENVFLMGI